MIARSNGGRPAHPPPGSAVYVDTENLRDNDRAHDVIAQAIAGWPAVHPPVASLSLYVRADKVALWRIWAEASYPALAVRVRGVQHFSANRAKNSADLAITADAVADLITGQAAAVAVISNDSDFGALFVKVRELADAAGGAPAPFLWITAPDAGALSPEMERFVPALYRWDLSAAFPEPAPAPAPPDVPTLSAPPPPPLPAAARPALPSAPTTPAANPDANPDSDAIAQELIRRLPLGKFKVADAQKVIKNRWPQLPDADDTAKLGQFLLQEVWPLLEKRGVMMPRKSSPRTYEITQAAKDAITPAARPSPAPTAATARPSPAPTAAAASEPTPAQLAAAVAAAISDDLFSASEAQAAIRARWPGHPAASQTAQQFGIWFKSHLWPMMARYGVGIAKEKPRRYEMTPDARQRIAARA